MVKKTGNMARSEKFQWKLEDFLGIHPRPVINPADPTVIV